MNVNKLLDVTKIGLMTKESIFLCTVTFNLQHKFNKDISTASTDGTYIEFNPDYFSSLTRKQRVTLLAHETWHVAFMHMVRCEKRDPKIYNIAADFVINQLLYDAGFDPLPNWLQSSTFKGMSTNKVYDLIKNDLNTKNLKSDRDIIYLKSGENKNKKEIEINIKNILVKAKIQTEIQEKNAGSIPGEIIRELEKLVNPILPWNSLLQRFLTDKVKNDYSWNKPNKRFMPDFYLPSQYSESLANITIAIDTSGSISKKDLIKILSEIQYIRDTLKPEKLTILDCDSKIHNIFNVSADQNILDLQFSGGGGSNCFPVLDYCNKNPTTALIYFTDLYFIQYNKEINFPLLWIVYDNIRATVNVGEIIHYKM